MFLGQSIQICFGMLFKFWELWRNVQHVEEQIARAGVNLLNNWSSGLMSSNQFGDLSVEKVLDGVTPGPVANGTLERIENRGAIRCVVLLDRPWLGIVDDAHSGLDVELCRALSAAMFKGETNNVEIIEVLTMEDGFAALAQYSSVGHDPLASDDVDVLASAPCTLENDVWEPSNRNEVLVNFAVFL
mmetsp:Transcript_39211/g.58254  ORF Transcript_39211/g.58254 Transcript_39211/m.58254 type:complete len:187 (+) Transcript_39211:274-834(+)